MKMIIDIDEDIVQDIIDGENDTPRNIVRAFQATIADAIKNGTPLPKGHGRLIDASNLLTVTDYDGEIEKTYVLYDEIKNAPTIIEGE